LVGGKKFLTEEQERFKKDHIKEATGSSISKKRKKSPEFYRRGWTHQWLELDMRNDVMLETCSTNAVKTI
jgi:hypothetical protein